MTMSAGPSPATRYARRWPSKSTSAAHSQRFVPKPVTVDVQHRRRPPPRGRTQVAATPCNAGCGPGAGWKFGSTVVAVSLRVVIVQHGDKERRPGDPGLTDLGRTQAAVTARRLACGETPVAVWSSPMRRAQETAAAIADELGVVPAIDARLRERMNWDDSDAQSIGEFTKQWRATTADQRVRARTRRLVLGGSSPLPHGARRPRRCASNRPGRRRHTRGRHHRPPAHVARRRRTQVECTSGDRQRCAELRVHDARCDRRWLGGDIDRHHEPPRDRVVEPVGAIAVTTPRGRTVDETLTDRW